MSFGGLGRLSENTNLSSYKTTSFSKDRGLITSFVKMDGSVLFGHFLVNLKVSGSRYVFSGFLITVSV